MYGISDRIVGQHSTLTILDQEHLLPQAERMQVPDMLSHHYELRGVCEDFARNRRSRAKCPDN